jgi:hypothetical protein
MPRKAYDTVAARKMRLWKEAIFDLRASGEGDSTAQTRLEMMRVWRNNPWAYLTARDVPTEEHPEGRQIIWTADERDDDFPVKPFPGDKPFLAHLTAELWSPRYRIILLDKVRQMLCTTLCAANMDWYGCFREEREMFISRLKEDSAAKLLNDKIVEMHGRKPAWLKAACPMKAVATKATYESTRSQITAVGQTFATSDARGPTGSLILVDEAAFQSLFPEIYTAVLPMVTRLWAITTANIGDPGADLFYKLIREGRKDEYGDPDDEDEAALPQEGEAVGDPE